MILLKLSWIKLLLLMYFSEISMLPILFWHFETVTVTVTVECSHDSQMCTTFSEDGTYNGFETSEQNQQHWNFRKTHQ